MDKVSDATFSILRGKHAETRKILSKNLPRGVCVIAPYWYKVAVFRFDVAHVKLLLSFCVFPGDDIDEILASMWQSYYGPYDREDMPEEREHCEEIERILRNWPRYLPKWKDKPRYIPRNFREKAIIYFSVKKYPKDIARQLLGRVWESYKFTWGAKIR